MCDIYIPTPPSSPKISLPSIPRSSIASLITINNNHFETLIHDDVDSINLRRAFTIPYNIPTPPSSPKISLPSIPRPSDSGSKTVINNIATFERSSLANSEWLVDDDMNSISVRCAFITPPNSPLPSIPSPPSSLLPLEDLPHLIEREHSLSNAMAGPLKIKRPGGLIHKKVNPSSIYLLGPSTDNRANGACQTPDLSRKIVTSRATFPSRVSPKTSAKFNLPHNSKDLITIDDLFSVNLNSARSNDPNLQIQQNFFSLQNSSEHTPSELPIVSWLQNVPRRSVAAFSDDFCKSSSSSRSSSLTSLFNLSLPHNTWRDSKNHLTYPSEPRMGRNYMYAHDSSSKAKVARPAINEPNSIPPDRRNNWPNKIVTSTPRSSTTVTTPTDPTTDSQLNQILEEPSNKSLGFAYTWNKFKDCCSCLKCCICSIK